MSWAVSASSQSREDVFDVLDDSFDTNYPEPASGVREQYEQAKDCVDGLLGILRGDLVNASLSGHAQQFDEAGNAVDSTDSITVGLTVAVPNQAV